MLTVIKSWQNAKALDILFCLRNHSKQPFDALLATVTTTVRETHIPSR